MRVEVTDKGFTLHPETEIDHKALADHRQHSEAVRAKVEIGLGTHPYEIVFSLPPFISQKKRELHGNTT